MDHDFSQNPYYKWRQESPAVSNRWWSYFLKRTFPIGPGAPLMEVPNWRLIRPSLSHISDKPCVISCFLPTLATLSVSECLHIRAVPEIAARDYFWGTRRYRGRWALGNCRQKLMLPYGPSRINFPCNKSPGEVVLGLPYRPYCTHTTYTLRDPSLWTSLFLPHVNLA